jgi:hypothetical protein
LNDVNTGDRVLARANQIIVMSKSDLDQKQAADRAEWQKRGSAGKITTVNADSFTILTQAGQTLTVTTSPQTTYKRYAPDSTRFADAKSSSFTELKSGDQVRVLGDKQADTVSAQAIVSGAFRNFAGTVVAVDSANSEITLTDLETKKPVTVKVNHDSVARRMPPQMAEMLAQRRNGAGGEGTASRTTPMGEPPTSSPPSGANAPRNMGASRDLGQMLERMPALTLAELKPGDALIVASTEGVDASRATAISILAGVEPLLTGPASDRRLNGPWSLDINMAP